VRRVGARRPPWLQWSIGAIVATVVLAAGPAAAQTASPPGPWVLDIRGVTSPVPTDAAFYPPLATAFVPSRGFGVDVGAHLYLFNLGLSRIGFGANLVGLRASAVAPVQVADGEASASTPQRVTLNMWMVAPQVSANFGSRDGWSYLSAGIGPTSVDTKTANVLPGRQESGRLRSVNFGGGARWFIKPRLAFGFDLRAHQIAAGSVTPKTTVFAVSAGLSVR
jgi:hypothetical protein